MSKKITGIMMTEPMMVANLADIKSVTRRTRGLSKINEKPDMWKIVDDNWYDAKKHVRHWRLMNKLSFETIMLKCPYGEKGDILWFRETHTVWEPEHCASRFDRFLYRAGIDQETEEWRKECIGDGYPYKWTPGIHMKMIACRMWAEVIEVRLERVNDITKKGAISEGIERRYDDEDECYYYRIYTQKNAWCNDPQQSFMSLISKINGPDMWTNNLWVWVVKYKILSKTGRPKGI